MPFLRCFLLCLCITIQIDSSRALGQLTPIGPFTGTHFDNFNNNGPGGTGGHQQLTIFNGLATVQNLTSGGSLKIEFSSSLNGDLVSPRSPPTIMGQLGISQWTFHSPITQWGGYWENNSRFDDATVQFFDVNNTFIGSTIATVPHAGQSWVWNGWQSTTPVSRLTVTGNDVQFLNGFIWWEDFQATASVPEPTTYALLVFVGLLTAYAVYRRRKSTRLAQEMPLNC